MDKAKVPEAVWKPQEDLPAEDKNFFVRDNIGVIAGSLDGVAAEATDKAQLVGLGLKLASDPCWLPKYFTPPVVRSNHKTGFYTLKEQPWALATETRSKSREHNRALEPAA